MQNAPNMKLGQSGVEIASAIVEAGVREYEAWKPDDFPWQHTEDQLVRRIFIAMCAARSDGLA